MDENTVRAIVREVLAGRVGKPILLEASARHVHLTEAALEKLFGPGAGLGVKKELSQPGEFLSDKRVRLVTPKGTLADVAVLGPPRPAVQVELSATDCRALGLDAPVNLSGDLRGAGDVCLVGEKGTLEAPQSAIIAKAHVHLAPVDAAAYGVADGERVRIRVEGRRAVTFEDVAVRVRADFRAAAHIDFDEANACGGVEGATAFLLGGGGAVLPAVAARPAQREGAAWEGRLVNEAAAKELCKAIREGPVRLPKGALVTPAARDVFTAARVQIAFQ